MDRAIAIAFGGEEVLPEECSHSDFYDLGLRCPSCGEIVMYVKGYTSTRKNGKVIEVGPCFRHQVESDPQQAEICDKRVRSISNAEWEKRKAKSREQRLRILQRYFWQIFCDSSPTFERMGRRRINQFLRERYRLLPGLTRHQKERVWQQDYLPIFMREVANKSLLAERLEVRISDYFDCPIEEIASPGLAVVIGNFREKIRLRENDLAYKRLHTLVCKEVIEFLGSKSGQPVLEVVAQFCYMMTAPRFYDGTFSMDPGAPENYQILNQMIDMLAMQMAGIHWSQEIGNRTTLRKVAGAVI